MTKPSVPTKDLTPAEVASTWPTGAVTRHTVWRWMGEGVLVNGTRVRLRSKRVAGRRVTTPAWRDEFIAAITVVSE